MIKLLHNKKIYFYFYYYYPVYNKRNYQVVMIICDFDLEFFPFLFLKKRENN